MTCSAVTIWPEIGPHGARLTCCLPAGHAGEHGCADVEYLNWGGVVTRHDCGTEHADDREQVRCTYQRLILANLQTEAAAMDRPPTPAQVADLWAHAREMRDDGSAAARWCLVVLSLG